MKILITEDQFDLLKEIQSHLISDGFRCESASTYAEAYEKIHVYEYNLLIIDINLPDGTGLDLIRAAKRHVPGTPIVVISARNTLNQKVEGLELGADDYLTKPFDMAELSARVKSVLRRWSFDGNTALTIGTLSLDPQQHSVKANNLPIELTRTEYNLLLYLFSNPGRVLTRESIAEHIWGDHMDMADSFDFLYTHMKNLRKKIRDTGCPDPIKAVYGIGYKLSITP